MAKWKGFSPSNGSVGPATIQEKFFTNPGGWEAKRWHSELRGWGPREDRRVSLGSAIPKYLAAESGPENSCTRATGVCLKSTEIDDKRRQT